MSVRLAVAAQPPADVTKLARGSVGTWVGALAWSDAALAGPPLLAALGLFSEVGQGKRAQPRSVTAKRLLNVLPGYRNKVIGHGSTREANFYDHAAGVLIRGLRAAWAEQFFLPAGSRLVYTESVELDPAGLRRARLLELMGDVGRVLDPRGTVGVPDSMLPQRLYLKDGDHYRSLHPWALFRQEEFRERVFFFNGLGRRAEVLDYGSGDTLGGARLERAFPGAEQDLYALFEQQREAVEAPAEEDPNRFGGYRLLGKLGEGGMGVVYLAEQESLQRLVALKMLPKDLAEDAVALSRFRREVAALSRCDHPNVVKILASGDAGGVPYYAMEYVEGSDLSRVAKALATSQDFESAVSTASEQLRAERTDLFEDLPVVPRAKPREAGRRSRDRYRQLAEALRDAARGVEHLHGAGIVHRDLKPGNLMVTALDHRVVVMDLGLAMVSDASRSITRDKSQVLGTLRYMPPEQLQRNLLQVDRRADVYSLGATFYELLTDKPFFDGDTEVRLIEQVLREDPVPPEKANPKLPSDLATIVREATEKDPAQRYDTADALAEDVAAYLDGRPIAARPPTLWYLLKLSFRRNRALAGTIAAAVLVLLVGTVLFMLWLDQARRDAEDAQAAEAVARRDSDKSRTAAVDAQEEAERERGRAVEARQVAEDERRSALRRLSSLYLERGRQEFLSGYSSKAAPYLAAAYAIDSQSPILRFLLAQACAGLDAQEAVLRGHEAPVQAVAYSPDATRILTTSDDGTARIWDAESRRTLHTLAGHTSLVRVGAFSPDGSLILTGGWHDGNGVRVWDARTGEPVATIGGHTAMVVTAVFSPDGAHVLTASLDKTARVWDARSGEQLLELLGHEDCLCSAAFDQSGAKIVTAAWDKTARIWEARTGALLRTLSGHRDGLSGAAFGPRGDRIATASQDRAVRIWAASDGKLLSTLTGHRGSISSMQFSPDGKLLVTAGLDHLAILWDVVRGVSLRVLTGHRANVIHASFSPDGTQVATASSDETARVWDVRTGTSLVVLESHTGGLHRAVFGPRGRKLLTSGDDGTARIWSLGRARTPRPLVGQHEGIACAAFAPDGQKLVTAGVDGTVCIWEVESAKLLKTLRGHEGQAGYAIFRPDGRQIATAGADKTLRLWDVSSGSAVASAERLEASLAWLRYSPAGRRIISHDTAGTGHLWDADRATVLALLGKPELVAVSSDDTRVIAVLKDSQEVPVWDARSGKILGRLSGHSAPCRAAAFSPDGSSIVTGGFDGTVRVWDADSLKERKQWKAHDALGVNSAEFSPDGRLILTGGDDATVKIWDAEAGVLLTVLGGHGSYAAFGRFSADQSRVYTWSADRKLRIFSTDGQRHYANIQNMYAWRLSAEGLFFFTKSRDGMTRLHDARQGTLLAEIERTRFASFGPRSRHLVTQGLDYRLRIWNLQPESRSAEEVASVVEARGAYRLDESGSLVRRTSRQRERDSSGKAKGTGPGK